MSTEDQNKAVVTLHIGVDVDAFIEDMVSGKNHNEFMPGRPVELFNEKPDSLRNVDFVLTREEAELLKGDSRIIDVRFGTKIENGIFLKPSSTDTNKLYSKTSTIDNTHYNWAIPACVNTTNPFSSLITDLNFTHGFPVAGNGVDVVIQDSGIDANHPEWLTFDGTASRLQQINWPSAAGLSETYTQSIDHYTDIDGHGTHVAGTTAGRLYGWAKSANIYAITIIDNPAAFGISASFNLIRGFHNNKTVTSTGYKRPTVVNMSWGYFKVYENITGGNYRGTPWTATTPQSLYGMVSTIYNRLTSPTRYYHPVRVASVDADIADCVSAGVILVAAAGNDAHKIDNDESIERIVGIDYNNFYTDSVNGTTYYHRGATPCNTAGVVTVGSVKIAHPEGKNFFSNTGAGLDLYAPGEYIMSAIPETSNIATSVGTVDYPLNEDYKSTKISGTSMASPQVAGVVACMLEARPSYNQTQVRAWLAETTASGRLSDTAGGYADLQSLQGGPNKFLRQPFNSATAWRFSGS
jgi:subtilisin family serine protease